ncbi:MAG: hypothetical protein IKN54_08565, partial [Lachnospiraceae bacterium]|nr:hypothetical protein [Lachnospiraceae bacterium]
MRLKKLIPLTLSAVALTVGISVSGTVTAKAQGDYVDNPWRELFMGSNDEDLLDNPWDNYLEEENNN